MVFSLIFAAGALYALAVLIDHFSQKATAKDFASSFRTQEAARLQAIHDWANDPETLRATSRAVQAGLREEHDEAVAARYKSLKKAAKRSTASAVSTPVRDVTSALVSMGWPRADCKTLAENAVTTLGPTASIEELTIYALTHKP